MPELCLTSLAQIIANDVGLCGAVLKTANSPLFGGGRERRLLNHTGSDDVGDANHHGHCKHG